MTAAGKGVCIDFKFVRVGRVWLDAACRYALSPVLHTAAVVAGNDRNGDEQIIEATKALQDSWRARVLALRRAGSEQLGRGKNWIYASNCSPIGIYTMPPSRSCGHRQVCPFCWCRCYVVPLCRSMEYEIYHGEGVTEDNPTLSDILEIKVEWKFPQEKISIEQLFNRVVGVTDAGTIIERKSPVEQYSLDGAFQIFTIEPPDPRGRNPVWKLTKRILGVGHPVEMQIPEELEWDAEELASRGLDPAIRCTRKVRTTLDVTRRGIAGAVGRVLQYPRGMLRGPENRIAEMMNYRVNYITPTARLREERPKKASGLRSANYYGVLRNKSKWEKLVEEQKRQEVESE